jgi:ribosomal-protein-alanine N-acetyltransferase
MAAKLTVEPMTEADVGAVVRIEAASNPSPWSEGSFRGELSNRQAHYLVAKLSGKVVAYCGCWDVIDEAHITNVAVDPEHRGEGIGRRLMVETLRAARDRGITCSTLEVRASNAIAIKLYEDLGYVRSAVRTRYYSPGSEDAVVMWLYGLESFT